MPHIAERRESFVPGTTYHFDPPVSATGFPVGGPKVASAQELFFKEGFCIGYSEEWDAFVFQGYPIDDSRGIKDELLRVCYFHVKPGSGSVATPVEIQGK